jgi:hypothetical protein
VLRTSNLVFVGINHSLKVTVPMMVAGKSNGIPFMETCSPSAPSVAESTSLRTGGLDMGKFIFRELSAYLQCKRKRCYFVHIQ